MMNRLRLRAEGGFTLIELLVVIAIIGILAAIAIPQFAAYRKRAYESAVKADLRNAATAQEANFSVNFAYVSGSSLGNSDIEGFNPSPSVAVNSDGAASFTLTATHSDCSSMVWTYLASSGAISGGPC